MEVDTDDGVRRDTSLEALSGLRPVFKRNGIVTAGNSSQTSDGASFTLIVSEKILKEFDLTPMASLKSYAVAGVDPLYMGIGPVKAIPKALVQADLRLDQIEQIELNEAFAKIKAATTIEELDAIQVSKNNAGIAEINKEIAKKKEELKKEKTTKTNLAHQENPINILLMIDVLYRNFQDQDFVKMVNLTKHLLEGILKNFSSLLVYI